MSWQREYRSRGIAMIAGFFAFVFVFMALIFAVLFSALIGILLVVAAVAIPFAIWFFGKDVQVTCSDAGFRVRTRSKTARGGKIALNVQDETYGWHEVVATNYHETTRRRGSNDPHTVGWFEVETVRGKAFSLRNDSKGFHDLIEVFNSMTPQLPYVWKKRTGFAMNLGPVMLQRGAYVQVARDQSQAQ